MSLQLKGFLFDIYNIEDTMHLWILDDDQNFYHLLDRYHPVIYAHGSPNITKKLIARLSQLGALSCRPESTVRRHFYKNESVKVTKLTISRPSVLRRIRSKLYALYRRLDIYHSDIEVPTSYMFSRNIYPLAPLSITVGSKNRIESIRSLDSLTNFEYRLPPLRILSMALENSHRLGLSQDNPLLLKTSDHKYRLSQKDPIALIDCLNYILKKEDPDVILSAFGDQIILPALFKIAQRYKLPLYLDRDQTPPTKRKIVKKGSSYNTYGSWIFRAPSYPLFGRWHIDSANSFVFKEAQLLGIIELARLSRLPVQRLARSSTGSALTSIETLVAIGNGYLVPWQKSSVEESKTMLDLIKIDKGGLIFVPETSHGNVYENVIQIDFSQMYPSIMVNHNISPETVSCLCCRNGEKTPRVPEAGYHICIKRSGVVAQSLDHILKRRAFYKKKQKKSSGSNREIYSARQNSLKWMLVTSFGYLGYRNAKFGRIESHESVTSYGREKLLRAKDIAEKNGYQILHAITDCLFIHKSDTKVIEEYKTLELCQEISRKTGVEMQVDATFSWLVFPGSRSDNDLPVVNRYFGRLNNGDLKFRGIALRRKDTPIFIRSAQSEILETMKHAESVSELKKSHPRIYRLYLKQDKLLKEKQVPWRQLLIRKTVSREREQYQVAGATYLSLMQLHQKKIDVQPGEKIQYLVINQKHPDKSKRYLAEELVSLKYSSISPVCDTLFYRRLLWDSYKEIWQYFAPIGFFDRMPEAQGYLF